jgi:hypothetical protein
MKTIILTFSIVSLLISLTCGQSEIKKESIIETDNFIFNNYSFKLVNENGECVMIYNNGEVKKTLKTSVPAPCKVVRSNDNSVRFETIYPELFLIAGGVKQDKDRCSSGNNETGYEYQIVIAGSQAVILAEKYPITGCTSEGLNGNEFAWASEAERGARWRKEHNKTLDGQLGMIENNKFSLESYSFQLLNRNGECILTYKKEQIENEVKIDVPLPCAVVRRGSYEFPEGNDVLFNPRDKIFTIGGDVKKTHTKMCDFYSASSSQDVVIRDNGIKLNKKNENGYCFPLHDDIVP